MTADQVNDYNGAAAGRCARCPVDDRTPAEVANWFQDALRTKGTRPRIPGWKSHGEAVRCNKWCYRRRYRVEIMFGPLNDWRRVATCEDRRAKTFLYAVALTATVVFWH
jgi:transposase